MSTTTTTQGGGTAAPSAQGLFVRNATGLVRAWATFDAFVYSFFSINLVTLAWYTFSSGPVTSNGNLITAIVISSLFILCEVIVYAGLISVIPRAGGDYVWQTRILGGSIGFVLAITGWVFILWLWVPIYGNILAKEFITPVCTIMADWTGSTTWANWASDASTNGGIMLSSVITCAFATVVIALGMKFYARIQRFCFYGGMLGLLSMFLLLLVADHTSFVNGFNHFGTAVFGVKGNAYQATVATARKAGYSPVSFGNAAWGASWALIPLMLFFNLWPNWGATLYGEVRGAGDFLRNLRAMGLALIVTAILAVLSLVLIGKVVSGNFYNEANFAFWSGTSSMPIWPYPGLLAAFLTTNHVLQLWLVLSLSLFFWGWCGTVFMSSTRVIFAAAFDRTLPDRFAEVSRSGAPLFALAAMMIPGLVLAYLYSYNIHSFQETTLDATLVIAVTFLGSTIAAIVLPWRMKRIYDASPIARYQFAGIPLITVAGVIFGAFLVWNIWKWLSDSVYFVNDKTSLVFMGILYAIAIGLYAGSRLYRRQQGVSLDAIHREIPVE
jgi:APA family basic amino acid/polyamine antiporter